MNAPPIRATYTLVDHDDRAVTEASYRGRWQLVQFGVTACRVVCPRALVKLSGVLDEVDAVAGTDALVPLYITVDPERDSPQVLKAFLTASHPRFTGLTGTTAQVAAAKSSFRIFTRRRATPQGYDVAHTAITYLLDPEGRPARHWADTTDAPVLRNDLIGLIGSAGRADGPVASG